MRRRFRFDPDIDEVVEIRDDNYFLEGKLHLIRDDIGAGVNGLRAVHRMDKRRFDSKSGMRRDAAEMGLVPVGDDKNFASKREAPARDYYGQQTKAAYDQLRGNYNGVADLRRRENERRRQ